METDPSNPPPPNVPLLEPAAPETNWLLFFIVLLAPAMLSIAASSTKVAGFAMFCTFVGSAVAGLACGVIIARGRPGQAIAKGMMAIGLAIPLAFVSFVLCFAGCALGGY